MDVQSTPQKPEYDTARFVTRLLTGTEADTAAYRALRNKIRNSAGVRNFADSYTREDALNEQLWREWCAAKREHCIVGTFDKRQENRLISIMMITAQGASDSLVAEWEATWVEPDYRGTGVAGHTYKEVFRQTKEDGYQHAVVFIRDDNNHSRKIREGQGFTKIATHDVEWADGTVGPSDLFILDLYPCPPGENRGEWAIGRLEVTHASMGGKVPFIEEAIEHRIDDLREDRLAACGQAAAGQRRLQYG
jgi:L-amino acid N-acyltransferase YncA